MHCHQFLGVHLRDSDSGRSMVVKNGERLELELESNPTTGYSWKVAKLPDLLDLEGKEYRPDEPARCGSGGRELFRFIVARAGSGPLRLEYRRPWEKDVGPSRTFEVRLESV